MVLTTCNLFLVVLIVLVLTVVDLAAVPPLLFVEFSGVFVLQQPEQEKSLELVVPVQGKLGMRN